MAFVIEKAMEHLAAFDAQPWAPQAKAAWRAYWEDRNELSPVNDPLARVRFMAFWQRCRDEGGAHFIELPFVGRSDEGEWLHLKRLCSREELQA